MQVEQISAFIENTSGRLAEVAGILAEAGINIRALALAETSDFGILRLNVNDTEKARQALKDAGFTGSQIQSAPATATLGPRTTSRPRPALHPGARRLGTRRTDLCVPGGNPTAHRG